MTVKFRHLFLLTLPLLAGCLSTSRQQVTFWTVDYAAGDDADRLPSPKYESVRLTQVSMRPPFDTRNLVVLRPEGEVAFDTLNEFAAGPSALAKGVALDVMQRSGFFALAVPPTSAAHVEYTLEFSVRQLALDCRAEDSKCAVAEVSALLMKRGVVVAHGHGDARVPLSDQSFSVAFSQALSKAMRASLNTH